MQDVTCFGRSLLLWLWSLWGWEEAPFSPCLCWHRAPTIPLLPGVCSSRKLLLSVLIELLGRCNLHISVPRGCNAWGQEPAHVLWSVCRIQVLRRERSAEKMMQAGGVYPWAPGSPLIRTVYVWGVLPGLGFWRSFPGELPEGWVLLSIVGIRGL